MAEYLSSQRRHQTREAPALPLPVQRPLESLDPLARQRQAVQAHTVRPVRSQTQAASPVLRAAGLQAQEVSRVEEQRQVLQRQLAESSPPKTSVSAALQRQAQRAAPLIAPKQPSSVRDWVTVMRLQAQQAEGVRLDPRQSSQLAALQLQVAQTIVQRFRQDRQAPDQRVAEYSGHLVSLQRHPISAAVGRAVLGMVPSGDRLMLQRAVDHSLQREAEQQAQDASALQVHSLQRQLAELEAEATQPVFQRIQARRGAGNPLPVAVQRHLEQGLNHDLSSVRVHVDAEADTLAKGVNAVAFTTGSDIFFRSGTFNPNTRSGLELLAHEVTHTVQQAQGKVGKGIDPDAGLETEARTMGARLATGAKQIGQTLPAPILAPRNAGGGFVVQRQAEPGQQAFKIGELNFWKPIPAALFDGAKQSLVDVWELIKNLPVITRQLPELSKKAVAWLRTMDTVQEWRAVAHALGMGALTAGQNWLKKTAAEQGRSLGQFLGKLIGEMALGKGAGAALRAVRGGSLAQLFDDFIRQVDKALAQMNHGGPTPALAGIGDIRVAAPRTSGPARMTATSSAGGAAVSKALQAAMAAKNWLAVKGLLGKTAPTQVPKGYFYRKAANGKQQIVRINADDDEFAALTIDDKGKVQVANPNVSDRISNPTAMNNNFKAALGREQLVGYQLHHLIPDNKVRSHPLMQWAQQHGLYDLDRADNLIEMPGTPEARQAAGTAGIRNGVEIIGHFGSHSKYDVIVEEMLDAVEERLRAKFGPNLSKPGANDAFDQNIRQMEKELRKMIQDNKVPTRVDPKTGTKVIASNQQPFDKGKGDASA